MALKEMPKVGDKVRHVDSSYVYDVSHYDGWGDAVITLPDGFTSVIPEEDFEYYELISKGADNMTHYTAEQRQARKGERIVIVEPCEHDSENYERGDIFIVDKVDSAGVTTTTGNIVYHEEYEVLPETIGITTDELADGMAAHAKAEASDNVHSPQHYRQGGVEVIDIIRDAVRDADGFEAVCHANVIKYVLRYRYKNGVEDVKKARVYLDWLIAELESKEGR